MTLNRYPDMMIQRVTVAKNTAINFHVITFFNNIASGRDKPTTPIIKAIAVPRGTPLATSTCTTGKIPEALEYIGTAKSVQTGTASKLSLLIYFSKKPSGTYPCISPPIAIPTIRYGKIPLIIFKASSVITGRRCLNDCFSLI